MGYFVRGPDGRLYGPAEVEALRDWARADRLPPEAVLIAEDTRTEATAAEVLGNPETWPPVAPGTRPCPNCGRPVASGRPFCAHCGAGGAGPRRPGSAVAPTLIGCSTVALIAVLVIGAVAVALVLGVLAICKGMNNPSSS